MSVLKRYAKYIISSPKLYRIYRPVAASPNQALTPTPTPLQTPYAPSLLESLTDVTISYVIPFTLLLSVYQRKLSYVQFWVLVYVASRVLRSICRLSNPTYLQFLGVLEKAQEAPHNNEALEALRTYDFEFSYFPVTHNCSVSVEDYVRRQRPESGIFYYLSYVIAHSFGIRAIYPGLILGGVLRSVLEEARGKLVVEEKGVRVKVRVGSDKGGTVDIDAMVFDRRNRNTKSSSGGFKNGDILVICCEGNAGFYEIGMVGGALSEGYSVIGWNHPGFGGSSGTPYPKTELTAALGVMDYAVGVLGFETSSIMVYGWSIGGFPSSYLASRFPNIKGLVLDATFDNVLPLAIPRMPEFMSPLVVSTIRNHVNLDNTANLEGFSGPIRIVRRVDDEIIADPPGDLKSNRGNHLLIAYVLKVAASGDSPPSREVVKALTEWVERPHDTDVPALDSLSGDVVKVDNSSAQSARVIEVASSILRDYKSTHCTPLPKEFFRIRRPHQQ